VRVQPSELAGAVPAVVPVQHAVLVRPGGDRDAVEPGEPGGTDSKWRAREVRDHQDVGHESTKESKWDTIDITNNFGLVHMNEKTRRRGKNGKNDEEGDDWLNFELLNKENTENGNDLVDSNQHLNIKKIDNRDSLGDGNNFELINDLSTSLKSIIFGELSENPILSIKELKAQYKDANYETIKSYYHEWHDKHPQLYEELREKEITPLIPKKITSSGQFSHDYVKYSMGIGYTGQTVYLKENNNGKDIIVFGDAKSTIPIAQFTKKDKNGYNIDKNGNEIILIGKKEIKSSEFAEYAARETNTELARRYGVSKFDICKARKEIDIKSTSKFDMLRRDSNGRNLTPDEQLTQAAKYMKEIVLSEDFKHQYNLKKNEAPTRDMLRDSQYSGFYYACWHLGINYNSILRKLNLEPNKDFGKWDKIKYDEKENLLPKSEMLQNISSRSLLPRIFELGIISQKMKPQLPQI
jgi:hypothetical protein